MPCARFFRGSRPCRLMYSVLLWPIDHTQPCISYLTYDHHKAFIVLFSFSPYLKSGECLTTCINSDQCYRFLAEDKHNE